MGRIILTRPGMQVICGNVFAVHEDAVDVIVTVGTKQQFCNVLLNVAIDQKQLKRLSPVKNAFVIATIHPTEDTLALADGAMFPNKIFRVTAYNVRYSGSFDFKCMSNAEEEHVFCGNIIHTALSPDGKTFMQVAWKRNGEQEIRTVFVPRDIRKQLTNKAVFVTGEKQVNSSGHEAYKVKGACFI